VVNTAFFMIFAAFGQSPLTVCSFLHLYLLFYYQFRVDYVVILDMNILEFVYLNVANHRPSAILDF